MNIIVAEDERIILKMEAEMIRALLPDAEVSMFSDADECVNFAAENTVDIAFLDIELEAGSGIELAKKLQVLNPSVNIIFCTGYSEYSLEALELYCSGYLLKPLTEEKIKTALNNLRYPLQLKKSELYVRCFGNFEILYGGEPVSFKYGKTKELFAYLVDRAGAVLSIKEIMAAICETDDKDSYIRNIKADLIHTFQCLGIDDVLVQERGRVGVRMDRINCDYYDYLNGRTDAFHGEYMSQYSFGEETLARLNSMKFMS